MALHAKRLEWVGQMLRNLVSAAEAEKRAVLAITDKESETYADEARASSAALEQGQTELEASLRSPGTPEHEVELLAQFTKAFAEYRRVDKEVLRLAVMNTNIKASNLAYGPAADAINELDLALSRIVTDGATSNSPKARNAMLLASRAQAAALRIEVLLAPHIAEESDLRMDDLEARMTKEDLERTQATRRPRGPRPAGHGFRGPKR